MMRSLTVTAALFAVSFAGSAIAQPEAAGAPPEATAPAAPPEATPAPAPAAPAPAPAAAPTPAAATPVVAPAAATPVAPEHVTLAETPEPAAAPSPNPPQPQAKPAARFPLPVPADAGPRREEGPVSSRFNIGFNLDTVLYNHQSFDLFSSNDVSQLGGVSIGYAVVDGAISLVPEIGFGIGSDSGSSSFGRAIQSTELDTRKYYGGFSLRWAALSFLEPEARVAVGGSISKVTLTPELRTDASSTKKTSSPFGSVGVGFTLHTPVGARSRPAPALSGASSSESRSKAATWRSER